MRAAHNVIDAGRPGTATSPRPAIAPGAHACLCGEALGTGWVVAAQQAVRYEVRSTRDLFDLDNRDLLEAGMSESAGRRRRLIVMDSEIDAIYGERLRRYLVWHGVESAILTLSVSERSKTMDSVLTVIDALDAFGISRRCEPVVAIGGGVLLDIAGLAASLYRRNTPYIRVPTTLMGIVDAGIGVKTGVNHGTHKNRLGSYFPAMVTLLDRAFLTTLDSRHLSNGLAEILKMALVKDRRLFQLLEHDGERLIDDHFLDDGPVAEEVLSRAIHGMLDELHGNLWEERLERCVDFGHTFSPTVEMQALPALLHGEAVAIDMALSTALSVRRGLVSEHDGDRILATMRRLRLPVAHELCRPDFLWEALQDAVRHRDGLQRMPLPVGIGAATFVNDVRPAELAAAVAWLHGRVLR